ncbi:MAG: hypothetical protein DMG01_05235 [Acidobacteria bacterium]|nr:MAG: hypothetical protein DMG01_05235 [Acidobacteriota bacterium]
MKFEQRAAQIVRARLRDDVHLARLAPEFGGVDAGLHFELFERVDGGQEDVRIEVDVGVVDAVQRVVVELAALPRNRQLLVGARAALAVARLAGASELGARVALVALLITVTVAPGTKAPVESFTSPVMVPSVCAKPGVPSSNQVKPTNRIRRIRRGSFREQGVATKGTAGERTMKPARTV